jgi:hypothetical protein
MNECIDSTMVHIHVCFAVLLVNDDPRTSWSFQKRMEERHLYGPPSRTKNPQKRLVDLKSYDGFWY